MNLFNRVKSNQGLLRLLRHQGGGNSYGSAGTALDHKSRAVARSGKGLELDAVILETKPERIVCDETPAPDNSHPDRAALRAFKSPRGLVRWITSQKKRLRFMKSVLLHQPNDEERAAIEQRNKDDLVHRRIRKDAFLGMRRMSRRYQELMFADKVIEGERIKVKRPGFDTVAYDWNPITHEGGNTIQFHLDSRPGRLPNRVFISDLLSEKVTDEIQYTVDKPIRTRAFTWGGIVEMFRTGNNGLPIMVSVQDAWKNTPLKNLPMLSFPLGIGETGQFFHKDLEDCPHLLVVGGSRQGKSNMINVIICTYLNNLEPRHVQFVLFDLKNGMEFSFYTGIPHLYKDANLNIPGIIMELKQAVPAMEGILKLMNDRMLEIRSKKCKNINDYNKGRRGENRMPCVVVIFDDYIALSLIYGKQADDLLTILSSQAAAAGIYLILGAQYPKADRIPSVATLNFQVVIAFKLKPGASNAILGDHSAVGLPCRGRASIQDFDRQFEAQTPYISDSTVQAAVEFAITGQHELRASRLDIEEILAYALEHFDGRLDIKKLHQVYKGKIGFNRLVKIMKDTDEQTFDVNGTDYLVTMKEGRPRRMVLAEDYKS